MPPTAASSRTRVREDFALDARVLSGEEEAQLTFLGAMSGRAPTSEPTVVIDIGGGSTEFIVGRERTAGFHVSTHAGSRPHDRAPYPQGPSVTGRTAAPWRWTHAHRFQRGNTARRARCRDASDSGRRHRDLAASIDQELDPYDPARVHGYTLQLATVELLLARLAEMDEAERRRVVGLDRGRAPTIIAGMVLLEEAMKTFGLEEVEVSEHGVLYGGALRLAGGG